MNAAPTAPVIHEDAPPTAARDADLWHVFHDDSPNRALCGVELLGSEMVPYCTATDGTCVVCVELAERYIDGTWEP